MKKTLALVLLACTTLMTSSVKAQSYFAAETTSKGIFTYVEAPEGTKELKGASLKGKAVAITKEQFFVIRAGKKLAAIKINGVDHNPTPVANNGGGLIWCSYELPNGGTGWYQCKPPKPGVNCCTMTIEISSVPTPK